MTSLCSVSAQQSDSLRASDGPAPRRNLIATMTDMANKVISWQERIIPPSRHDTLYMERNYKSLSMQVFTRFSGNTYQTATPLSDAPDGYLHTEVSSPMRVSLGAGIYYRSLSASVNVNPDRLLHSNSDYSYKLSSYGNRFGFEWFYHKRGNLRQSGSADRGDGYVGRVHHKSDMTLSAYYVLNGKRFSYAAATTQMWRQKRSAGSIVIGAALFRNIINEQWQAQTEAAESAAEVLTTIRGVSIDAGYAYNGVPDNKKWLFHFSAIPGLVVYNHIRTDISLPSDAANAFSSATARSPFPNMHVTGRFAVVRYLPKGYLSLTATVSSIMLRNVNGSHTSDTEWRSQLSYGFTL